MKNKKIFDTKAQNEDVSSKIVVGLERISEAFRVLLWENAKTSGLSPIQIQILVFIKYHPSQFCGVTYLAKEFNMAKPTISDAVKSLNSKGLITKYSDRIDSRSYTLGLSKEGQKIVAKVEDFAFPIKDKIDNLEKKEKVQLLDSLIKIIYNLNKAGIITVQRTCYACKFYEKSEKGDYCNVMKTILVKSDLRLDCPEFQAQ